MKRFFFNILCVIASIIFCPFNLQAQYIWGDSFEYAAGTLLTANGWSGHSGSGTNDITVSAGSLSYLNYMPSNIGNKVTLVAAAGEDVNHSFPDVTSGTLYAAFMVNVTSAKSGGDYFAHFMGQSSTTFSGRIFAKSVGTGYQLGIAKATTSGVYDENQTLDYGTTYLVVMKYQIISGTGNDVVSLFINPVVGNPEPATPSAVASDVTGTDPTKIAGFALRQGSASTTPALDIDGIRIATTWNEAVKHLAGSTPTLTVNTTALSFGNVETGTTAPAQTITVSGTDLTGNITYTVTGDATVFGINAGLWNPATGGTLDVTFSPTAAQTYSASIVFSSDGAGSKTVTLTGTGFILSDFIWGDSFEYTVGSLLTANGWNAHSGAGTNAITVSAGALSYLNYAPSGIGNKVTLTTSGEDVNHTFPYDVTSGTLYAAFMINVTSAQSGDYFVHFMGETSSILSGRVYAKSTGAGYQLGIVKITSGVNYADPILNFGTTYLAVMKFEIISGTMNDRVSLFVNPVVGSPEPATPSATDNVGSDPAKIAGFALRQGTGSSAPALAVSGIRVATTWNEAVNYLVGTTPVITVNPTSLSFGNIETGTTAPAQTITVSGTDLTGNITYTVTGDATVFGINAGSWNPATGGTLDVTFSPTAAQPYSASIVFSSDNAESKTVTLTGTGIAPFTAQLVVKWNEYPQGNHASIFLATGGSALNNGIATLTRDAAGTGYTVNADGVAVSTGWQETTTTEKYWITKFSTIGFTDLTFTSKQMSSNTGPKDFKVQYKVGASGTWIDVANGTIVVLNDNYISGTKENIPLPGEMNNQEEVFLRWLCTSTVAVNNSAVVSAGTSRLNVVIYGEPTTPTPVLTVSPVTLTFGNVNIGTTSPAQTITVSGTDLTGNITYTVTGDATVFGINAGSWNPATGGTLDVTFSPTAAQTYSASIVFSSDGAINKTVTLSGTGIFVIIPTLNVSPTSLSFGDVEIGVTPPDQTITVSGTDLTGNITYTKTGADAAAFTITETSWNLFTGGTLSVTFIPTEARAYEATLNISSEDAESKTVTLTGTGLAPSTIELVAKWNEYTPIANHDPIFLATGGSTLNNGIATLTRDAAGAGYIVNADGVAASTNWENATTIEKYWITKFSTIGFTDLTFTSKQRGSNTGPKDFKVQYKVGASGTWIDVANGTIVVLNDNYISGVKENIPLPSAMSNKEEVFLRWLCTSTVAINGSAVVAGGVNRLDVAIYGEPTTPAPVLTINPVSLTFGNIETGTTAPAQTITVSGINLTGNIFYTVTGDAAVFGINAGSWNPATGGTLDVTFSPTAAQTYNASIVFNSSGANGKTVTLSGTGFTLLPPVADFTSNKTVVFVGESVQFNDLSTNIPTSWSWSFTGGTPSSSTQQNPSVTYNTAGTYSVSLTATNADGSNTKTVPNYITVEVQGANMVCNNSFESWTANKPNCWFGSKTSFTVPNVLQYTTSAHSGTSACQLVETSSTHKRFTTQTLSVVNGTTYQITFWVRGQGDIRTGLFDDRTSGSGYATYNDYIIVNSTSWAQYTQEIEAANTSSIAEFIFSVRNTVAGNDHIQIDDVEITETLPVPELTVNPTSLNFGQVLIGNTSTAQTITVSGTDLTGNITYVKSGTGAAAFNITETSWNPATGGTLSVTFSPTAAESYTATITISSDGAADKTVSLSGTGITPAPPVADFTSNKTVVFVGESVQFTDQSTGAPTSWSWSFAGGTPSSSTQQNPSVTYNTAGTYSVSLTATNADGSNTKTVPNYITVEVQGANMVCNNSFESWTANKPDCWFGSKTSFTVPNVLQYTTSAHSGTSACQLVETSSSHRRFTTETLSVVNGTTYQITFWVRGQGDIRTGLFDDRTSGSGYATYNDYIIVNSTSWAQYTQEIEAANTSSIAEFIFSVRNTVAGNDHIQIDDVEITAALPVSELTVNPTSLNFGQVLIGNTSTAQTITVSGINLTGNITYVKSGTGAAAFNITETSWNPATGGTLSVTFSPTAVGSYTATITISSDGAADKTVSLSGSGITPAPPVANFTSNKTVVFVGESVQFTDQSTNIPTSWSWSFTGGTPSSSTQQNPSVTYNTVGSYSVSLTVTNADGSNTKTVPNYITVQPQGANMVCNNSFEAWTANKPDCWFGSKTSFTVPNVLQYTTSAHSGTSACQLVETSSSHRRFTTETLSVVNGTTYQIKFWVRGQGDIRTGLFDDRTSGSGYATYNDYIIVNSTSWAQYTQEIEAANTSSIAEFIFSVRNTDVAKDHIQIDDVEITAALPVPALTVNPTSLNFGQVLVGNTSTAQTITVSGTNLTGNITYVKSGTGAAAFNIIETSWNPATGGTLSVTFSPTAVGSYTATITISSDGAADKTVSLSGSGITPAPPVANFTSNKTVVFVGESVQFTDQSTNIPTSWSWSFTGGTPSSSTQQNPSVTYNTVGSYSVSLTVTNANGSDTKTVPNYITVQPQGANMVCNNSFESWTANKPDCWFGAKTSFTGTNVIQYTTSAHSGTSACQLIETTSTHKRFTTEALSVVNETTYQITFWVRGQGDIRTGLFDDRTSGSGYATYNPYISVNSTSWTKYTQEIEAANTSSIAEFIFSVRNTDAAKDHIQIDDVEITAAGSVPGLVVTPGNLSFGSILIGNTSDAKTLTISGNELTGNITYVKGGADASSFTITETSWNPATGGVLSVTFAPTELRAYSAIITVSSPGVEDKVVPLTGTGSQGGDVIGCNGGFEEWTDGKPNCWFGAKTTVPKTDVVQYSDNVHGGNYACQLINTASGHKRFTTEAVNVVNEATYQIKFWVRGQGDIRTGLFDDRTSGSGYATYNEYISVNSTSWTQYIQEIEAANTSSIAEFIFSIRNTIAESNHLQIDDVEITESSSVSGLIVSPTSLNFGDVKIQTVSPEKAINVSGNNLTGNITYTKEGADAAAFTIIETSWNPAEGGTLNVTFAPTETRAYNATITFSSPGVESKVVSLSGTGTQGGGVVVCNGGFEEWTGGKPDCWFGEKTTFAKAGVIQYSANVHGGNYACQLINADNAHKRFTTQPVTVVAGKLYNITFWVRGKGEIRTALFDAREGNNGYTPYNDWIPIDSDTWTQYTQTVTAETNAANAEFIFSIRNTDESADHIQIDDVEIYTENAIIEIPELQWTVFPNPTTGELRITNYELRITGIEIFDVMGRKAPLNPPEGGRLPSFGGVGGGFDISHLPSGIYFLRIQTENGKMITKKVVKN